MRKLSFEENLRHRLSDLPRFRHREEKSTAEGLLYLTLGAAAGLAVGALLAQKFGGVSAIASRVRSRFAGGSESESRHGYDAGDYEHDEDEYEDLSPMEELEERVLEAYHNDPILCERAVDIGAIDEGIIELTGWVHSTDEAAHAVTIARGTPGVSTVVNRLAVREEEELFDDRADRYARGDDELTEGHWEGQQLGIGRTRQGTSGDPDRHADPKVELEDRWMQAPEAYKEAAGDMEGLAERRKSSKSKQTGDRTGGSPIAPTGVPKGDHVIDPTKTMEGLGGDASNALRGD